MRYISTRGHTTNNSFVDVLMQGLAPDGGLFMPLSWPQLGSVSPSASYTDIALQVIAPFVGDSLPQADLKRIISKTYTSDIFREDDITPLRPIGHNTYLLELFHGPTLAFKDIALQLLGNLFEEILEKSGQTITIVGATSGDTGSAAIEAVRGRKNISITMLHPKGRTSDIQRRQMTSIQDDNVHNIAIEGTFDDCQNLVKGCFADAELRQTKHISAVNSINWARIIAQTIYYVVSAQRLGAAPLFAVPTGNFGNVLAAWVGKNMGAPIGPLVIGSNRNDILTRFFETGSMTMGDVTPSYSPSMDIQISSNFERYLYSLMGNDSGQLGRAMTDFKSHGSYTLPKDLLLKARADFTARRCSDDDTIATIRNLYQSTGIIIDPHTAVGLHALNTCGLSYDGPRVVTACADPAKFPDVVKAATGITPQLPPHLADLMDRPEKYQVMANDFATLKKFVMTL